MMPPLSSSVHALQDQENRTTIPRHRVGVQLLLQGVQVLAPRRLQETQGVGFASDESGSAGSVKIGQRTGAGYRPQGMHR